MHNYQNKITLFVREREREREKNIMDADYLLINNLQQRIEALEQEVRIYRTNIHAELWQQLNEQIIFVDQSYKILFSNQSFQSFHQKTKNEVLELT